MYPTLVSNRIADLWARPLDKSVDAKLAALSLLLAAFPVMRWYALRLQDGGGELAGLVPLMAAIWFAVRDWKELERTSQGAWIGILLLLIQAVAYPFLPPMIRALLMIAVVASVFGIWKNQELSASSFLRCRGSHRWIFFSAIHCVC